MPWRGLEAIKRRGLVAAETDEVGSGDIDCYGIVGCVPGVASASYAIRSLMVPAVLASPVLSVPAGSNKRISVGESATGQ